MVLNQESIELAAAIADGNAVAFVGAGLSQGAGAPGWDQLRDDLRHQLHPSTDEVSPTMIAQFYRNQFGSRRLVEILRDRLRSPTLQCSAAHQALIDLPFRVYLTTNYDDLLERSLRGSGQRVHLIRSDRELALWDESEEVQVVKLHGDIDDADSIVISEHDYLRFLVGNKSLQRKMSDLFAYRSIVFIGYSMRDVHISQLYAEVADDFGTLKRQSYLLTVASDDHLDREWRRRGITPIHVTTRDEISPTDALSQFLLQIKKQVARIGVCDVLIVDDEQTFRDAVADMLRKHFPRLRIEVAHDGYEASLLVGHLKPTLVIADNRMPGMGGAEFAQLIRRRPETQHTRVILVSGFPVSEEEIARLPLWAFMPKPVNFSLLLQKIEQAMTGE